MEFLKIKMMELRFHHFYLMLWHQLQFSHCWLNIEIKLFRGYPLTHFIDVNFLCFGI